MLLRISNLHSLTQIAYKETCCKPVLYKNKPISTRIKLFYVKIKLFTSNLCNFAIYLHPCTETDVKSFKFVFFDSNDLKKDVLR